jgi:hypothetical protein
MIGVARNERIGEGFEQTRSPNYAGIAMVVVLALVATVLALFWSAGSMGGPWVFDMRPAKTQMMAPAPSGSRAAPADVVRFGAGSMGESAGSAGVAGAAEAAGYSGAVATSTP